MEVTTQAPPFSVNTEETSTKMMVYTANELIYGAMPHNEHILASRILTGMTIPEFIELQQAQIICIQPNFVAKPRPHEKVLVPTNVILGYHLMPPLKDQLDYDETEPNRRMAPVTLYMGALAVQGSLRISEIAAVRTAVAVIKADFVALYDLTISHPHNPGMAPIRSNMGYFRIKSALVAE